MMSVEKVNAGVQVYTVPLANMVREHSTVTKIYLTLLVLRFNPNRTVARSVKRGQIRNVYATTVL